MATKEKDTNKELEVEEIVSRSERRRFNCFLSINSEKTSIIYSERLILMRM